MKVVAGRDSDLKIDVPFFRPSIGDEEINAVVECLRSGWLTTGAIGDQFEKQFVDKIAPGVTAVGVNSATAGMHLVLDALGIGTGDEVIVPTLTFTATAEVVHSVGASVKFVDVDPSTLNITLEAIKRAAGAKTKAVIVVHFAGLPCRLDEILPFCSERKIAVIEDCAHCFPADLHGVPIGAWPTAAAVFSFYANKSITTGEGGMIVTHSNSIAGRCRVMRLHGISRTNFQDLDSARPTWDYDVSSHGFKYNLPDIAAAIGCEQLKKAEHLREQRCHIASLYIEKLSRLPILLPPDYSRAKHGWHLFIIQLLHDVKLSRAEVVKRLKNAGIETSVHYRPLHQMSYWRQQYTLRDSMFPIASAYFERCISLPFFPSMTEGQVAYVADVLSEVILA
jgi:dTDP-4-amino-4,6-dideoxygalactose transaminase